MTQEKNICAPMAMIPSSSASRSHVEMRSTADVMYNVNRVYVGINPTKTVAKVYEQSSQRRVKNMQALASTIYACMLRADKMKQFCC